MDVLSELVKFLQEVSPLVWQSLIRQVYAEAIAFLVWGAGLALVCLPLYKYGRARIKQNEYELEPDGVLVYIGVCILAPISLVLITSAIQRFINPEFYAIRFIISSIGGG